MRIAVTSSTVFPCPTPGYAGLEMVAWHTAAGLAARGHQVLFMAPDGSACPGVQVVHTGPAGAVTEAQAYDRYWQHLLTVDAVITHSWQKHEYRLKMEGRLRAPVLGVWHAPADTMYRELPAVEKPCTVLISKDHCAHYEALFGKPGRYVHNGVDHEFYRPMSVKRTKRALFLARFSAIKGADIAARACRAAGVCLDLVGDTSITNEPEYAAQVAAMCDGTDIRLVGPETRGGCVARMSSADFFLHPNLRFREPFGLAPVEAQCCGLPVVTFRKGAMPETVVHGETGFVVDTEEEFTAAVKAMAQDGAITDDVRRRCRENGMKFSIAAMVEGYEKLCFEAVRTGGW